MPSVVRRNILVNRRKGTIQPSSAWQDYKPPIYFSSSTWPLILIIGGFTVSAEKELKAAIEKECKVQLRGARAKIKKMIEGATLSLMGLERNSLGRVEFKIDHCNSRNSVLIDAFRELAIEEAKKIAVNYSPTPETIVKASTAFQREYDKHFNNEIRRLVILRAKNEAQSLVDSIDVDVRKSLDLEI